MHSRAVTRATTAASSLLSPMSEMGPSKYPKPGHAGLQKLDTDRRVRGTVRASSESPSLGGKRSRSPLEYGPEPYEEFFSPTRSATSGLNDLQRHRSTKQLISRYETMELSAASSRASNRRTAPSLPAPIDTAGVFKKRKASPIRHSIKNFLSVFTKGRSVNKDDTAWTPTTERTNVISLTTPIDPSYDPFTMSNPVTKKMPIDEVACNTPTAIRSGTLLYLSWCSTSPNLPVWTSCTAALHRNHLLLTCLSPQGNPSTRLLDLTSCADVRSLALNDINPDERALLPNKEDLDEFKPFEIQFEGKPKEKLAATSVHDRAAWVSAIWSAVLQTQGTKEKVLDHQQPLKPQGPGSLTIMTDLPPANSSAANTHNWVNNVLESDTPSTLRTNLGTSLYSDRSLPPTPASESDTTATSLHPGSAFPTRITLHDSPPGRSLLLSGTTSRTSSPSHLSPSSPYSRAKSPSVAKLDNLSVVKQRLAQIEQDPSRTPPPSVYSPTLSRKSTRKIQLSPLSATSESAWTALPEHSELGRPRRLRSGTFAGSRSPQSSPVHESYGLKGMSNRECLPDMRSSSLRSPLESSSSRDMSYSDAATSEAQGACLNNNVPEIVVGPNREAATREKEHDLEDIREKLEDLRRQVSSHSGDPPAGIVQILETMQAQLKSELPLVVATLQEIDHRVQKSTPIDHSSPKVVLNDVGSSSSGAKTAQLDVSDIHAKLDNLLKLHETIVDLNRCIKITTSSSVQADQDLRSAQALELTAQLNELLKLSKSHEVQQTVQNEQQADSSRYLNELNTWLESFVSSETSQMQAVASGVLRLQQVLGCANEGAQPPEVTGVGRKNGLLSDIQQLLADNKNRDQRSEILQVSLNRLFDIVNEDVRQNAEARNASAIDHVMDLINRQHQDQDNMLRALSAELTSEIRGERLRFVDAMKEATEINVQSHIEQFKKELTREVLAMTQDVGRLHKERQAIEQQIADLFAFYSKQKQKQSGSTTSRRGPSYPLNQHHENMAPLTYNRSFSQRRPLPKPLNPWNQ